MNASDYMKERVDDQIKWLSRESSKNQGGFKKLRAAEIVMGCAIAYLVSHAEIVPIQVLTGAMGVAVAAIGGLLSLHRFPPRNQVRPQPSPELVVATVSAGRQPVRGISKVTRSN